MVRSVRSIDGVVAEESMMVVPLGSAICAILFGRKGVDLIISCSVFFVRNCCCCDPARSGNDHARSGNLRHEFPLDQFLARMARILDLGPCFGTNGHFRRDPDVISRLPDTTTQDLSVFIGFRC